VNGNCAEWIVEGHAGTMSYLGATFFFDCLASETKPAGKNGEKADTKTRDLTGATFLTMGESGKVYSAGLQKYSNNTVLGVMAEQRVNRVRAKSRKYHEPEMK
jgi:hypothetical protein